MEYYDNPSEMLAKQAATGIESPDLRRSLSQMRINAVKEIERVDELLSLLDKNQDVEKILKLLGRNYR